MTLRGGHGRHTADWRATRDKEMLEVDMSDVTDRQTVAKEDIIRSILEEYANGGDGAACMTALAPLVEWLLEDHEYLLEVLHDADAAQAFEMF